MTTDKKIITKYIKCSFEFSSYGNNLNTGNGWCVRDISTGNRFHIQKVIYHLESLFPNMGSEPIVEFWYEQNKKIVLDRVRRYLEGYKLIEGKGRKAWDVVNKFGKILDMNELYKLVPDHHPFKIDELFYEWFVTAKEIATERLING